MEMYRPSVENVNLNSSIPMDAENISPRTSVSTPRPTPRFFCEPKTFSTKKELYKNGTPREQVPPKPPAKSAPPLSRIFKRITSDKPMPVSFKNAQPSLASPMYNPKSPELYIKQCFDVVKVLGNGSFGEVYEVEHKHDGKHYAIKRTIDKFRSETDKHRRFKEVAVQERLPSHPNCLPIVRAWQEREHLYIQSELCCKSLQLCAEEDHNLPEQLIRNYLVDLLMALKHMHNHDMVHLDIKPENIFITKDGRCMIGDFGLALDLSKDTSDHAEGDSKYMAPELMNGVFTRAADVYSLGISMLELCGDLDLPSDGQTWHDLRTGTLPPKVVKSLRVASVSVEFQDVITWMMQPDPYVRPSVDQLLEHPFVVAIIKRQKTERLIKATEDKDTQTPSKEAEDRSDVAATAQNSEDLSPQEQARQHRAMGWDHSSSDDDVFGEEINLHNNSVGVPFDVSSSSTESNHNTNNNNNNNSSSSSSIKSVEKKRPAAGRFAIPRVPLRQAFSTPGGIRRRIIVKSPGSSPLSSRLGMSVFSSSPRANASPYFRPPGSISPDSSFEDRLSEIDELLPQPPQELLHKGTITPKSLLEAFDCVSDSE